MQYLSGVAAMGSAGEGSDGVADLAPLEEAEAAGGRRERGGRASGEGAEADAEERPRVQADGGGGRGEERRGEDGDGEAVVAVDEKLGQLHDGDKVADAWCRNEY